MSLLQKTLSYFTPKSSSTESTEKPNKDFNAVIHSAENADELKNFFSALNQKNSNPNLENIDFTSKPEKALSANNNNDLTGDDTMKQDLNDGLVDLNIDEVLNLDEVKTSDFTKEASLEQSNEVTTQNLFHNHDHESLEKESTINNLKEKFPEITIRSNYWDELTTDFSEEKLHEILSYAVKHNKCNIKDIYNIIDNGISEDSGIHNNTETEPSYEDGKYGYATYENENYTDTEENLIAEDSIENTIEKTEPPKSYSELLDTTEITEQSKDAEPKDIHTPAIVNKANSNIAHTQIKTNLAKMNSLPAKKFAENLIANGYRCGKFCIHYNICHFRLTDDKNINEKDCLDGIMDYLNKNTEIVEDVK